MSGAGFAFVVSLICVAAFVVLAVWLNAALALTRRPR